MSTTWINRGHLYSPHVTPVLADLTFTVDATNGLGITGLKGQAVQNVFMHTSTTPTRGPNGKLNPNPAAGYALIQLSDNYTRVYSVLPTIQAPVTGSALNVDASDAALTAGIPYQIVTLGTTTAADWLALGVQPGVTAAVGVSFVALATGAGTGTGTVKALGNSGLSHIELLGNSNLTAGPVPAGGSPNVGAYILISLLGATSSSVTTLIPTAPAAGTIINLAMYLNQSSVLVAGE